MLLWQGGGRGGLRSRIADKAAGVLAEEDDGSTSGQGWRGSGAFLWRPTGATSIREREGRCGKRRRRGLGGDGGWVAAMGAGRQRWGLDGGGGQTVTLAAIARNGQARGGNEVSVPIRCGARCLYTEWWFSINN
jgi:hypothetical protein